MPKAASFGGNRNRILEAAHTREVDEELFLHELSKAEENEQ